VGVVQDILHDGLKSRAKPSVYVPFHPDAVAFDPTLMVRTIAAPGTLLAAIRSEVARLNPEVALAEARTLGERVEDSIFAERAIATLSAWFGTLALLLAGIGIYGVMAYAVARRTGEIGLRIALGAAPASIQRMVLGEGLRLIALGAGIGLPLALAGGRLSASLLYGIKPNDPPALIATMMVLAAVGALAALVPARRAARVQPVEALRHE
jgi:predicted lysophospholipase L1 biosynthesis ABC-type transport system permease subunit